MPQHQIQAYFAILLVIVGVSHVAQPKQWSDFFVAMRRTGFAHLIIPLYTLPLGLFLVVAHNKWVWGWPVVVTICGWGMTIKSVIYWVFPGLSNRMIDNAERWENRFGVFRVVGSVMAVLGAIVVWDAWQAALGVVAIS